MQLLLRYWKEDPAMPSWLEEGIERAYPKASAAQRRKLEAIRKLMRNQHKKESK